ncbi:MAG: DUF362 domain-containing protein, partial [Planctomycetota bacterium]|nr:DUF362 domain-containing protein [Planctomycetota bacterium]
MSVSLTRRQMLVGGLGAAGMLAAARLSHAESGPATAKAMPDRSKDAPASPVAIQRCESYEPKVVREQLDASLKLIGGLGDMVRGKTVTLKMNLTGGSGPACGMSAIRTYHTHPAVVAALCAALADAGAKQIYCVESFYFREPCEQALKAAEWDVEAIKSAGYHRVTFENTRNRGAFPAYSRLKVPWGGFVYPSFDVNARYEKTDVMISVAKLKDHGAAGMTAAVKNFFGMPPQSLYGGDAPNEDSLKARVEQFHEGQKIEVPGLPAQVCGPLPEGQEVSKFRVPRIVADCFGARPVDLAIVEAVETVIGGEGPWLKVKPTAPKLLLAGRNAVCTDAVCTAVMGYDPAAQHMQFPFPGENHLRLLASVGVGTNDLKRIEVRGLTVEKARHPFLAPGEKITTASRPYYAAD